MNPSLAMPGYLGEIARLFQRAGQPCFAVGGCVRNALLGLPAEDYDICGPATVERVQGFLAEGCGVTASRVYGRMGTMRLHCREGVAEYTTFRRESYAGGHRPQRVEFVSSLSEDAFRRDFTINALYLELPDGALHDPTGGLADLERRALRATSPDPALIMRDDGLRVLRMVRFAAQMRLEVDPATYAAADSELLRGIAAERLCQEFSQILLSDARYRLPGGGIALERALRQLEDIGAIQTMMPGMKLCPKGCAAAPAELALRLAALLRANDPREAAACLDALRYPKRIVGQVELLLRDLEAGVEDGFALIRRGFAHGAALAALEPKLLPLLRDLRARGAPDSLRVLDISGRQVAQALGGPSPAVGRELCRLWRHAVLHPEHNNKDDLLRVLRGKETEI